MLALLRQCAADREAGRVAERDDALRRLHEELRTATPAASPTAMEPEGDAAAEGWEVQSMSAWCAGGRWVGRAYVRATADHPREHSFVFTLLDGTKEAGRFRGSSDLAGYRDWHPVTLVSDDPCPAQGRFRYRYDVTRFAGDGPPPTP